MKILHRYILKQISLNVILSLLVFTLLFLIFDFIDRVDNIASEDVSIWTTFQYFILKVPNILTLMFPIAMLVGTIFTIGLLSRNSEMTAMRASGSTVVWLALPIFGFGFLATFFCMLINETLVPYSERRSKEIYNIDIRQKDKSGSYSQSDIWWRYKNDFYSVADFDSRTNTNHQVSKYTINDDFQMIERIDADEARYVDPLLGWTMKGVKHYSFDGDKVKGPQLQNQLPLPIRKVPQDFYDSETDPETLSYSALKRFIKEQARNGLAVTKYYADLYSKIAFPFVNLIMPLIVLPFALQPARSGNMAGSITAGIVIGFSYYVIHSFSVAMGRAEIFPAMLAAWTANILLALVGTLLVLGSESPS